MINIGLAMALWGITAFHAAITNLVDQNSSFDNSFSQLIVSVTMSENGFLNILNCNSWNTDEEKYLLCVNFRKNGK